MSITDAIKDMEKHMGMDFGKYMNEPLPHNGQAYIQRDYKTGKQWVHCPYCGKKNFPIEEYTKISRLPYQCKGSNCREIFEVNV